MIRINTQAPKVSLIEGKFLRFIKKDRWEYVERTNCTGIVIVLALTKEGNLIFTEQYRPPVGKNVIEFPAGLVNDLDAPKKETLISAAKRELFEETGYKVEKLKKILCGPVSGGLTSDLVYVFKAIGLKKVGAGGGDHFESITVHEIPFKKVHRWLNQQQKAGKLVDPKVYAELYFLNDRKK